MFNPDLAASEILTASDQGAALSPFSARDGISLDQAYQTTARLRHLRQQRGGRVVGRKIGFTNRTIWARYNVDGPIWGDVWDTTLRWLDAAEPISLAGLAEPRIEPEIVFSIARTPDATMSPRQVLSCCDWIAHGVEIVQSPFPGWQFEATDAIIAGGLHGALAVGPRTPLTPDLIDALSSFQCSLSQNGTLRETGDSANVLDGPHLALTHLVAVLDRDPHNPPLAPGEVVTTGTLTDAYPVAAGEEWQTTLTGLDLPGLTVRFC